MPSTNIKGTGDFSDLTKSVQGAAKAVADLGLKLSGISTAGKAFDTVTSAISGTVNALGKIGLAASGIEAIGKSAVSMGMGLLQGNAALEMTTISFQTLLGSASAAQDMIKQLTAFAEATPFNLTGLEASTQKLLAFGYTSNQIIPLMTALGDTISALGGNQQNLDSLVYVFGQMHQEAHINAGDIMQMVNQGVPALQMLADHYHVTTAQIQEMISKGLIPGKDAVEILSAAMEKQYGGMMKAQSSTFSGMISNLQDWATQTLIILTKPLFDPAKKALAAFLNFVQSPAGVAAVNKLAGYIQMGVDKITKAFIEFEPHIRPTLEHVLQIANAIRLQFTPGIITLLPHLTELWKRIEPIALGFYKFYENVKPLSIAFAALQGYISGGVSGALLALQNRFSMLSGYIRIAFNAALNEARRFGPLILNWVIQTAASIARTAIVWGEALIAWVAPYAVRLVNELIGLAEMVLNWAIRYAPVLGRQLISWADELAGWVIPTIPRVLNVLVQFGLEILGFLERQIPVLVNTLLGWTDVLAGWVIPAIPGVISGLEQVGLAILNWGVTRLPQIIGQVIVAVGHGFGVNLRPAVNSVLLVFNALVANIRTTVLPAFVQMMGYLGGTAQPILNRIANFMATTIIPTFASLAAFTMTTLVPAFVTVAGLLGSLFGPALTTIGTIIRTDLLPALSDSWNYFETNYLPTVQNLADKFGNSLAGSIQTLSDKFRDILPKLEDFAKKVEPIIAKAIDLYKALSPINIGFDVLVGLLTKGLPGAWQALSKHIVDAGKVFGVDLQPTLDKITTTVMQDIIPALQSFWHTLTTEVLPNVVPAVQTIVSKFMDFGQWVGTYLWPILQNVFSWIVTNIGPIFQSTANTIGNTIIPAIKTFFDWVGARLWPKLQEVWAWIAKNVQPILAQAFDIIGNHIIPTVGDFIAIVLNKVIPVLSSWWGVIATFLKPIFEEFFKVLNENILPAIRDIWDWIQKKGLPAFSALADFVQNNVLPPMRTLADILGNTVGKAIGFVIDRIKNLIDFWHVVITIGDKLLHGDITGAIGYAWDQLQKLVKGPDIVISGTAPDEGNAAQVRLQQYIMNHPGYNPAAAGNSHASGTNSAPGGLALIGERGMELVRMGSKIFLATQPMLLNLPKGAQVFNNQATRAMLPNPASAQQISNMYQNSYANRSWDYSQNNSNNNSTQNYYINGQQSNQWSFGQSMKWHTAR